LALAAAALATAEFDAAALEARAGNGWTTLTELADTLVRDHGLPFKTAHGIAARLVRGRERDSKRPLSELLKEASGELLGTPLTYSEKQLLEILSPRHFVEIRRTLGGPAPEETARAAKASRRQLAADEEAWTHIGEALAKAEATLVERSAAL